MNLWCLWWFTYYTYWTNMLVSHIDVRLPEGRIINHQESSGITIIHHLFFPGPKRNFSKNDHWMYRPLETCDSPAIFFSSGPCVGNRQCHGPFVDSWDPMIPVESRWKPSWMMPKRLVLVVESKFLRDVNLPYFSCLNPPYGLVEATFFTPHSLYDSYSIRFFES